MDIFDILNFNVIQDEENYYFFRALNRGDNADIEQGITSSNGNITRVRTDRERWQAVEENPEPKYDEEVPLSLEQMYDHIKMHQRKDTNCISLSSNANVSISYGRAYYKDQYVLVRVPKSELGEKVKVAGQYMLSEIERRVQEEVGRLEEGEYKYLLDVVKQIDNATSTDEIIDSVFKGYSLDSEEKVYTATNGKKITTSNLKGRFSSYQTLSGEQNLAKNRLFAKLTLLEYFAGMERIIPHTATNSNLLATVGGAISSLELINYGDIEEESIIEIPSKIMDMLAILQQASEKIDVENESREEIERKQRLISKIESRLISHAQGGYDIEVQDKELVFTDGENAISLGSSLEKSIVNTIDGYVEPTIAEMYELTNGEVEYANMRTLLEKNYYVSRAKLRANEFAEIINAILGNNPEYADIIELIKAECFEIEPTITTRISRGGYQLSESVSVEFSQSEISLIDTIKNSSHEELRSNIEITTKENVERCIAHINERTPIDKNTYYAKALIASYDFDSIGITFTQAQKELFLQKLQEYDLPTLYEAAKNAGVSELDISKVLLNLCMNSQIDKGKISETTISENIEVLQENLYIEQIEDFLGFYSIEGTDIKLKEYQQRASHKLDEIYEDKRFASVILPTGAGKSFVVMAEMLKERYHLRDKENASKMLYLAPSNEILNQIQEYLIKYVIGTKGTLGKTREEIIKEAFPNLELATYASLKHRGKKRLENDKYDLIVLDELHRTGAKEWGKYLDKVLEAQDEDVRVLGITATPERDMDGRNMADEIALKMGYTKEEVEARKHVAMKMDLMDAIRNGIVVNPRVVSCEYNLQENERFINLLDEINQIEDENVRREKFAKYEELRRSIENAFGVSEILGNNLKNGGKYIVFIPVSDEEEIEDEFGNKILNKLSAEEKIQKAQEQLKEWLKATGKSAKFYSMLGAYSDKENALQLSGFENDMGEEIKFMLAINKLNEGVHIDNVDGIVWMRALDRNSKILLLQQMGRCIYALDENNPIPEELLPLIIDLPNNLMTVDMQKEINNYTSTDDLEMLQDIIEWIKFHNDHFPDIESKGREEKRKAITLKRIQQKYMQYLSEDLSKLDEEELLKIQQILELGEEIDLWNLELPDKKGKDGKVVSIEELNNMDVFSLEEKARRLCELEYEIGEALDSGVSIVAKTLKVARVLSENGFDFSEFKTRISQNGYRRYLLLKDISQQGVDIEKIITENGLDENFRIGSNIRVVKDAYAGRGNHLITAEEKIEVEKLGIVSNEKRKRVVAQTLEIARMLRKEGVDFQKIKLSRTENGKDNYILLHEIQQEGIDIRKIIEKYSLNENFDIGIRIRKVRDAYSGRTRLAITEEEKREAERLGLVNCEKKKSIVAQTLEVANILRNAGVDFQKIKLSRTENGKSIPLLLGELEQESVDIRRIIVENNLNENFKFGNGVASIRRLYNSTDKITLVEEEKREIERLGLVTLDKKQSYVAETLKVLRQLMQKGIDVTQIPKSKKEGGKQRFLLLKEIEQAGVDMESVISETGISGEFEIGKGLYSLRRAYLGISSYVITESEKREVETLGIISTKKKKRAIEEILEVVQVLKKAGVTLCDIPLSVSNKGKQRSTYLYEISQSGIDIKKIIEENGLDDKYKIGDRITFLKGAYKGRNGYLITKEEKRKIEELGILAKREKKSYVEEILGVFRVLKDAGVDLAQIPLSKKINGKTQSMLLREVSQEGIDIRRVIDENELDGEENIGDKIRVLQKSYNGIGKYVITEQEKREIESLGILEKRYKKSIVEETLEVARVLEENGVDLSRLKLSKSTNNQKLNICLGEIEQEGIDVKKIIKENGLNEDFPLGYRITELRGAYKGTARHPITEEEKHEAEILGLVETEEKKTVVAQTLEVARILKENGVDLKQIQLSTTRNKKQIHFSLRELQQEGIDILKIIEENGLDTDFPIGYNITQIRGTFKGTRYYPITDDEKREAISLGIASTEEKKSVITQTLEIVRTLQENGVDFSRLEIYKSKTKKYFTLGELEQAGVDIKRIIEENGLDSDFNIGRKIINLRCAYKGSKSRKITEEEKREAEELGIVAVTAQQLGKATYDASTPECVKMAGVVEELMQQRKIGGEIDSE